MKHTKKKKLLAFVLCMVLVLSTAITAFAVDETFIMCRRIPWNYPMK